MKLTIGFSSERVCQSPLDVASVVPGDDTNDADPFGLVQECPPRKKQLQVGSYVGFLRGYLGTSGAGSKSICAKSKKYFRPGEDTSNTFLDEVQEHLTDRPRPESSFDNHYDYFAHVHDSQHISSKEDRALRLRVQTNTVRRNRMLFPPFNLQKPSSSSEVSKAKLKEPTAQEKKSQPDETSEKEESSRRESLSKMRWRVSVHSVQEARRESVSEVDRPSSPSISSAVTAAVSSTAVPVESSEGVPTKSAQNVGSEGGSCHRSAKKRFTAYTTPLKMLKAPQEKQQKKKKEEAASNNKGGFMSVLHSLSKKELQRKEACDSIRFLVFGCLNEGQGANKQKVYEQRRGTKEDVFKLYKIWSQMDEDGSGDVEFQEFLNFFSKSKADRLLGMRCVKFLVGNGDCENATGCTIEDMMKLIWLKAIPEDIQVMLRWFREAAFYQERVPTPPLLPKKRRKELMENFHYLDRSRTGKISYSDLVDGGLVDWEMAMDLMEKYDTDGSGDLDSEEFLELLCPFGYRAHKNARSAIDDKGRQLAFISNTFFTGWTTEGAFDSFPEWHLDAKD